MAAHQLCAIAGIKTGAWRRPLLARDLSAEKPIVILSGNSIDHALIAFGALYAGIPFCPVRRPIRWCRRITAELGFLMKLLTPGLVFARRRQ